MNKLHPRLLLYSGSYDHIVDGVTLTLNRLVGHLESRGWEVMVVAPTTRRPELRHRGRFYPAPSISVPGRTEYRMATILPPGIRARIVGYEPDVIHIATPDLIGRWMLGYARKRSIPVLSTYHTDFTAYLGYYKLNALDPLLLGYLRYFYSRCDLVCVPSPSMIDELRARGLSARMAVWERGIETERFAPAKRSYDWRRSLGVDDETPLILYAGRVVREKNVDVIPVVSRRLKERGIAHKIVVVGEGPARAELRETMPEAHFTGRLGGDELACAFASADIFFFPSGSETFGNVVLEAMASALPCVCVDATGSRDLVRHGRNGYLLDLADIDGMTARLTELAVDPDHRCAMGAESLELSSAFRWEAVLDKMEMYYREIGSELKNSN